MWVLTAYCLFLAIYLAWIFGIEYIIFSDLHSLKNKPLDTINVALIFASTYRMSKLSNSINDFLVWLIIFISVLIIWELHTVVCGYQKYFKQSSLYDRCSLREFLRQEKYSRDHPDRTKHLMEYRYWFILDSTLLVIVVVTYITQSHIIRIIGELGLTISVVSVGVIVGVVNHIRYRIMVKFINNVYALVYSQQVTTDDLI